MTNPDDDKLMRQYLLSSLPEAETESCDERSFLDDDFAARLQVIEDELVDAYVRGELRDDELAQFQTYYLASPRRRENVRFAQSFLPFLEQNQPLVEKKTLGRPAVAVAEAPSQKAGAGPASPGSSAQASAQAGRHHSLPGWIGWIGLPRLNLQWGLAAATLVLFVAGGWLAFETLRLRQQIRQNEAGRVALQQRQRELEAQIAEQQTNRTQLEGALRQVQEELARLELERATPPQAEPKFAFLLLTPGNRAGAEQELTLLPATDAVKLRLILETDDYPAYRAELFTQSDSRLVWQSGNLKALVKGKSKSIELNLRASLFEARGYLLTLKGVTAKGEPEDVRSYPFKAVKR